jgi:integrase
MNNTNVIPNQSSPPGPDKLRVFERLGPCLYWKGDIIVARLRINGKPTWRSTGTNNPTEARAWLKKWKSEAFMLKSGLEPKGVVLHRARVTVGELIDAYVSNGMRTRKGRPKRVSTINGEHGCLRPVRKYFAHRQAASVSLSDADKYRDWRTSGGYFSGSDAQKAKQKRMRAGTRSVDLELTVLGNVFHLAVRRGLLKANPLVGKGRYGVAEDVRHCREVAPTPAGLKQIEHWLRLRKEHGSADVICFLAYSGLRINEALPLEWESVDWGQKIVNVTRQKRGITPWVPLLPELESLLKAMQNRSKSTWLFPSPFDPSKIRDAAAVRRRLTAACQALGLSHVTPHGLRSYFVTQARASGLSDAEIAMLIGDRTGPSIIAHTYGDIRSDHLQKQAQRIKLTVQAREATTKASATPMVEFSPN